MTIGTITSIHGKVTYATRVEQRFIESMREYIDVTTKIPMVGEVEVVIEGNGFRVYTEVGPSLADKLKVGQEIKLHIEWPDA